MTELTTEYLSSLGLTGYGIGSSSGTAKADLTAKGSKDELGQSDFLNLMITQLTNQDPTNPVDNEQFVAQMAQFSTLTGIQELNSSFATLSQTLLQGQTLEAASLVGKEVLTPASSIALSEEGQGVSGAVDLDASANQVTVDIQNASGQLVRSLDLGAQSAGLIDFAWDGLLEDGTAAPAGTYSFSINATRNGETEALETLLEGQVKSVSMDSGKGGVQLDIQGVGSIGFSSIKRVG